MKNIWIMAIFLIACGDSNSLVSAGDSQIPGGATLQDYPGVPGLQKAVLKSGDITIGEGDFLNGKYHGTWTSFGSDGRLQSITSYYKGKKQGVQLVFDNTGYVQIKASYFDDQLNGEYLVYSRRTIIERRHYSGDQPNGLQERFYANGVKMEEKNMVNGKIDGTARWFDEQGNLTIEYEYEMGELVND